MKNSSNLSLDDYMILKFYNPNDTVSKNLFFPKTYFEPSK